MRGIRPRQGPPVRSSVEPAECPSARRATGWLHDLAPGSLSRSSHRPPYAEKSFAKLMIKEPALQQTQGRWRLLVTGAAAGRDTAHVSEAREEP